MEQYQNGDDEIEIDIRELLYEFKRRIWLILAALVVGAGTVGAFSAFIITPQFTSETKLYVLSKETTLTSLADLQIGSQLTQDYKVMITSRPVLEGVIKHLNLDLEYKDLVKKLTIDNPTNTRILSLSVEDKNPFTAKAIVDDIATTASDYIGEIMEMVPPKLIEAGIVPTEKTSPNIVTNSVIGGLAALILMCGLITMRVVLNDTVKTEEDVQKYLGLPVLAVVPAKKDVSGRKHTSDKKRTPDKKGKSNRKPGEPGQPGQRHPISERGDSRRGTSNRKPSESVRNTLNEETLSVKIRKEGKEYEDGFRE